MKENTEHESLIQEFGIDFTELPVFMMYEKVHKVFRYQGLSIRNLCEKNPDKQVIIYQEYPLRAALIDKISIANFFIKKGFFRERPKPINPYYLLIQ
jgi:hypothetical protein